MTERSTFGGSVDVDFDLANQPIAISVFGGYYYKPESYNFDRRRSVVSKTIGFAGIHVLYKTLLAGGSADLYFGVGGGYGYDRTEYTAPVEAGTWYLVRCITSKPMLSSIGGLGIMVSPRTGINIQGRIIKIKSGSFELFPVPPPDLKTNFVLSAGISYRVRTK